MTATATAATERSDAFERAREASRRAMAKAGDSLVERFFDFGGRRVRMRIAGDELASHLTRPFVHLELAADAQEQSSLTIEVWDERATGVPYPSGGDVTPNETNWATGQGALITSPATRYVRYDCPAWVTWIDRRDRTMIGWRSNADRVSMHERTRPLPFLLPVWYGDLGVHVIHAGLVARGDTGILVCGSNGAGKSTTTIACLCGGLDFLSDDHVGLEEMAPGKFVGHSVFASTRLEPDHFARCFPDLAQFGIPSTDWMESKTLLLIGEAMPERVRRVAPISAIALPKVVDKPSSSIQPASRAEALLALAPSTMMQMPFGATAERFHKLAKLTASVPAFRLELGRDVSAIPSRVRELMDQVERGG